MYNEKTILLFQVVAAGLMGWDYLIGSKYRNWIDSVFRNMIDKSANDFASDLKSGSRIVFSEIPNLFIAIILFVSSFAVIFTFKGYDGPFTAELAIGSGLLFVFMLILASHFSFRFMAAMFISVGANGLAWILFKAWSGSDKGPIAFLGFASLLVSFYMRYSNAVAT